MEVEGIQGPPEGWKEVGSPGGMSNYDFSVDELIEERLMHESVYTLYAGWNFNGKVWYEKDFFSCQVWVYGSPLETVSEPTLDALMHAVSSKYGYE